MSPAHVLEPTYRRLKRALMDGAWPTGAKLEAQRLADEFGVSMTPVRDSLNQLVGEGLVDLTPGEGFRVAALSEQNLRDILYVNAVLLETAAGADWQGPRKNWPHPGDEYAERLAAAFALLAVGSGNRHLAEVVNRNSERLHSVRRRESDIIPDAAALLNEIEASMQASAAARRQAVWSYHRQCAAYAASLIEMPNE